MPINRQRTPSYRRHRPSGQAVVTLNGRDCYLGEFGTRPSQQAYDRLVSEWLANGRQAPRANDDLTITEVIAVYWRRAEMHYRHGNSTGELPCIKQALRPLQRLYGLTLASDFGPLALQAVRGAMLEMGWCRNVVNRQVLRLKQMFRWAAQDELVPPSLYHGLQAVTGLKRGRCEARETEPVKPVPNQFVDAVKPFVRRGICRHIGQSPPLLIKCQLADHAAQLQRHVANKYAHFFDRQAIVAGRRGRCARTE